MIGEKVITILFFSFAMFALFLEFDARTCPQDLYNNLSKTGSNQKIKNGKPVGKGNK